ncbi:PilW family protein [Anaerosinus gibii]|uniref:Prepilin-type N-terminal cleavage/methylation domain-containing protein n=1 Tax=Selenobaculum gibii TaxID=3054208 RepID=A0A9Y2ES52_9FIRM|nr:prepilin-type N-terminal cleavage/methylation domain-containing protein [Selenobaculum gbiensis]WIW69946.1 prepilin-type N-terminal cleavage/methylation domain-containing protein [Selenobaculum gbiensis]
MIKRMKDMSERGFTLIELCIGIALFAIIFAGMSQIFSSAYQVYESSIERDTALQSGRAVLAIAKNEIEAAEIISSPIAEEKEPVAVSRLQYQKGGQLYALYQNENNQDELRLESNIDNKSFHIEGLKSITFYRRNHQQIEFTVHVVYKNQSKIMKEVITMLN